MGYSITSSTDHCYPGTTVLINRLGLMDQHSLDEAEKILIPLHSVEIEQEEFSGVIDFQFYCQLHRRLFGDLYEWAGAVRTVDRAKKGTRFCPATEIEMLGKAMFDRLVSLDYFSHMPREMYVRNMAEFYHDLNMLHPFREGNGRVQRLFFTLLARRAGYVLNYSDCDIDGLMLATIFAAQGVLDQLVTFFEEAIR